MIRIVKIVHTVVWWVMTISNFLAFYFAFVGRFDAWFWVPASLIILEMFIIVFNKWKCPITGIAEKYTKDRRANFDIYLPEWLARYNVRIYTVLIVLEILVVFIKRYL